MHWFDIVILIFIAATLIRGFSSGLVMQAASLAGILLGAIFSGQVSPFIEPLVAKIITNPSATAPISFIIAFILLFIAAMLVGKIIQSLLKAVQLGFINRILGAVFCSLKWLFILSLVLNILVQLDPNSWLIKKDIREESHAYPIIKEIATKTIPYLRFEKN